MTDRRSDTSSKPGSSGWHLALERASADDGKPYLGDLETVGQIVRAFVGGICDGYAEVASGTRVAAEASAANRAECVRLGRVFAGEDDGYTTVGAWNGQPAVDFARSVMPDHLPEGGTPAETMAQVMAVLCLRVYEVLGMFAEDDDEESARDALDGACEDWTRLLLGLPAQDGGEPDEPER